MYSADECLATQLDTTPGRQEVSGLSSPVSDHLPALTLLLPRTVHFADISINNHADDEHGDSGRDTRGRGREASS